jgi:hypothetical protein
VVNNNDDVFDPSEGSKVVIMEKAGEYSKNVHFIVSGDVYIMNKDGNYEYAIVSKGSYFGDISILLNEPNLYSYAFNDYQNVPL